MIIRVKHTSYEEPTGVTVLSNDMLEDPLLSWGAKGLLAYLLSEPERPLTLAELVVAHSQDSEDEIRGLLRELVDTGYIDEGGWIRAE